MEARITDNEILIARQMLDGTLAAGADHARVVLDKSRMDLVNTLNGQIDKVTHCMDLCLTLYVFVDGRYGCFSTNKVRRDGMDEFIRHAIDTARMLSPDRFRALPDPSRTVRNAVGGMELDICDTGAYASMTTEKRLSIAAEASAFGRVTSNPQKGWKYVSEEAEYSDTLEDSFVIDSNGLECRQTETSFDYAVEVTVEDRRGDKYTGYWWEASPRLEDLDYLRCCDVAIQRAVSQMHPKGITGGKYNMVIAPEDASTVVSPILKALSAYHLQQNNSFLGDSLGKKVFPEGLTVIDDPHRKGETGSKLFDSEGVATRRTPIIENGVVREYFVNTYMSGKMGIDPTVEEAVRPMVMPYPRAGLDRDAIMAMCGSGILVTEFNGGNSNSSTGDFSYGIEGFYFEDGKIVCPVREMLVTGNFLTLWKGLLACGSDFRPCMSKLIPTLAFSNVDFSA